MKRTLLKWILLSLGTIMLITTNSAYPTWLYAQQAIAEISQTFSKKIKPFEYAPEEVLPEEEEGKNQVVLVQNLVEGENGLNKLGSYLNQQITLRKWIFRKDTLGSMGVDQKTELENLFSLESQNLSFLIQFVDDDTYYIFTTEVDLGENGSPNYAIETYIAPIYRTIVKKINGKWEAQTSAKGYAESAYYDESNLWGNHVTKIPSFDPDTWEAGTL